MKFYVKNIKICVKIALKSLFFIFFNKCFYVFVFYYFHIYLIIY